MPTTSIRRRISSHNAHVVATAILALLGAGLAWTLFYAVAVGLSLGILTILYGQEVIAGEMLQSIPIWLHVSAGILAGGLIVWGSIDECLLRYSPPAERAIIGWHVLGDFLLLAPRLTFSVFHHLSALVCIRREDLDLAGDLLVHVYKAKKSPRSTLAFLSHDQSGLERSLRALQLLGWLDKVRIEDDWALIIPSAEEQTVRHAIELESDALS